MLILSCAMQWIKYLLVTGYNDEFVRNYCVAFVNM
jgi:hypothetical protein